MSEPIAPQARPIALTGEPTWSPPREDDSYAGGPPPRRQDVRAIFLGDDGLRAGWSVLLFLLLCGAMVAAVRLVLHHTQHGAARSAALLQLAPSMVYANDLAGFLLVFVAAVVVSRVERRPLGRYGIDALTGRRLRQFALGAALGLGMLALLVGSLYAAGFLVVDGILLHGGAAARNGLVWAGAFLSVALFEEFLTRGFLQFTLTRGLAGLARAAGRRYRISVKVGFWSAATILSLVFGLGHTGNAGESPIGIVSAVLIGFIFAFSLWRTGSLWWAIGFHAAWDWAQSFLFGTADSGLLVQNHLLATHPVGGVLRSGGLTGPEGSMFIALELALTTLVIALFLKPEPGSYADPNWTPNNTAEAKV